MPNRPDAVARRLPALVAILNVVLAAGCERRQPPQPVAVLQPETRTSVEPQAAAVTTQPAVALAMPAARSTISVSATQPSIRGVVRFNGPLVKQREIKEVRTSRDPFCTSLYAGKPLLSEQWIIADRDDGSLGLANAVVWVSKGAESLVHVPKEPVVLDQVDCRYEPHILAVVAGQPIFVHNSDETVHNVRSAGATEGLFNLASVADPDLKLPLLIKSGKSPIAVECNVHPWMSAYIHQLPNQFFAVSDGRGDFAIRGLPAGEYELSVWHEFSNFKAKEPVAKVTIPDSGEPAKVEFTFAPTKLTTRPAQ